MVQPNYDETIRFLERWPTGKFITLTAIEPNGHGIETQCFARAEGWSPVRAFLTKHGQEWNLYYSVNPVKSPVREKAKLTDISQMVALQVDLDPRPGEDINEERKRALALLHDPPGLPKPTVIVDSGGGYQGFWLLSTPFEINGEAGKFEEAARYNKQLQLQLGGDKVHNVDRIMRLPGTLNRPGKKKLEKGRTLALASVVEWWDEHLYTIGAFVPAPLVQDASDRFTDAPHVQVDTGNVRRITLDELPKAVTDRTKMLIVQGEDPDEADKFDGSRSEWLWAVCCDLVRADVSDDMIYSIITDPDYKISESVLDKGGRVEKYALKQINDAKEKAISPELHDLNQSHAVISSINGKCRVLSESMNYETDRLELDFQTFEDFRNRYSNRKIEVMVENSKGEPVIKEKALGSWWLDHNNRRQFDKVIFSPNRDYPNCYNLWKGFGVPAMPGDCSLYLDHVKRNICQNDEEVYEYLMNWMAHTVQHPNEPGQVAVVIKGEKGTGKGVFANHFGKLFGRHYLQITNPEHLVGKFNAHLRECVVLFADEAFYSGNKKHVNILKGLVTEDTLVTERKGFDPTASRNYIHLIMASNDDQVVEVTRDERRFLVLNIGKENRQDRPFFAEVARQLENGGYEALLHMLMHRDLSSFKINKVPKTEAFREEATETLFDGLDGWWFQKLFTAEIVPDMGWPERILCSILSEDLEKYLRSDRNARSTSTKLGQYLVKMLPGDHRRVRGKEPITIELPNGKKKEIQRPWFYELPDLETCRELFEEYMGYEIEWPDEYEADGYDGGEAF